MAIKISLPSVLTKLTKDQRTLDAEGATFGEAIDDVIKRYPDLGPRLRDEKGTPYSFVTFYLNDEDIRFIGGFSARVQDGDEITVVPAIAGG